MRGGGAASRCRRLLGWHAGARARELVGFVVFGHVVATRCDIPFASICERIIMLGGLAVASEGCEGLTS